MNIYDIIPSISQNGIFKGADKEIVCKYLSDKSLSICKYTSKETIISPDTKDVKIGIILNGTVEITSLESSSKVLLKTAGRGAMFGVANLYARDSLFPTCITARCDTEVLLIAPDAFRNMLESSPILMKNFLEFLTKKIVYLNKKIVSYTAGNAEQKVAYFLCENAVEGVVETDMSFCDIAIMLNMGRASLYRSFDSLEKEKIIERNGRIIKILDKTKLKNIYSI